MDASPGNFPSHAASPGEIEPGALPAALAAKWDSLHAAAEVVALLAGRAIQPAPREFPDALAGASHWRLALAGQGIDDIAAMMEPGLSALLTVHAQGGDPRPAARALWQEFDRARQVLVTVVRAQ